MKIRVGNMAGLVVFWFFSVLAIAKPAPLIVLSFDGFRWDYIDAVYTPNLDRIIAEGFRVKAMKPSFPSLTFANHFTLVTGQHPYHHGIVSNNFYDLALEKRYRMYRPEEVVSPEFYGGPAIWEVAREHGLQAAVYFWVGSEVKGREAEIFLPFDIETKPETEIERLLQWADETKPPNPALMMAYFSFPDHQGHRFGPDSPQVVFAVQQLDLLMGVLIDGLEDLKREVNVLVVSDHGMARLKEPVMLVEDVEAAVGKDALIRCANNYSQLDVYLKPSAMDRIDAIMARLPKASGFHWYRREDVPFPTHRQRNGQIMGLADIGYEFKWRKGKPYVGAHGYNPNLSEMWAACFGMGPGFEAGSEIAMVQSVDVFSLMCHLLELPAPATDGSLDVWRPVLARE